MYQRRVRHKRVKVMILSTDIHIYFTVIPGQKVKKRKGKKSAKPMNRAFKKQPSIFQS